MSQWLPFLLGGASPDTLQVAAALGEEPAVYLMEQQQRGRRRACIGYCSTIPSA